MRAHTHTVLTFSDCSASCLVIVVGLLQMQCLLSCHYSQLPTDARLTVLSLGATVLLLQLTVLSLQSASFRCNADCSVFAVGFLRM